MRSIFDTRRYFRPPAKLNSPKLDKPNWQRLTHGKDCHMLLILIPTEGDPYGDDECIFARSDEKLG